MGELQCRTRFPASVFSKLASLELGDTPSHDATVPNQYVELPRLLLTPTRVAVVGFQVEMSNRVTRKYINEVGFRSDYFLRLSVGDENGDKLYSDQLSEHVESRISKLILSGIIINERTYQFLAYSSSQLKELSLWLVAPPRGYSVAGIRYWMGDFSMCKTPSKYAARMGQCFSTTVQTFASHFEHAAGDTQIAVTEGLADVLSYDGEKETCLSDGTGLIRKELMTELLKQLPFDRCDLSAVSIIQVRFGGAKGTLTAWNYSQLTAARKKAAVRSGDIDVFYDVHLRPSMVKFEAPFRHLEVVSIGNHIPYFLNRNVILLLGAHDVRDELFLEMQRAMLDNLDNMLRDARTAAKLVPRLIGPESTLAVTVAHMVSAGLAPEKEPFLFSLLHAIRTHQLTNLRKKSRIFVRDGAVLMGGLDETGLLPDGCVFAQVRHGESYDYKPLVGPLMVTKHPVMHPGDVRMLLGVDVPELRDHKNVILFSQWGYRSEADKMAGSDLDGDLFALTWEPRLFLKEWNCCTRNSDQIWTSQVGSKVNLNDLESSVWCLNQANADPMDYTARHSTPASNNIGDNEIIEHFINHAKSENVGQIAMLWLDYAAKYGADSPQCYKLAEIHSTAVDFPKSGNHAEIPRELKLPRALPRPHWRERKIRDSYHCSGVLGKLYDNVVNRSSQNAVWNRIGQAGRITDQYGQVLCFVEREKRSSLPTLLQQIYQPRIVAQLGWSPVDECRPEVLDLLMSVNKRRADYERQLMTLMSKYQLHSEGELLTGCIRKYHRLNKRRRHDLCEEIKSQCRELWKGQRRLFFKQALTLSHPELGSEDFDEEQLDMLLMVVERIVTDKVVPEGAEQWGFLYHGVRKYARNIAAAMYKVTYDPDLRLLDSTDAILFSFPWIVADVIAHGVNPQPPG